MYVGEEVKQTYKEETKTKQQKKSREEGIELLRIVSMFMVLLLHYMGKGGFLKEQILENTTTEIAWLIEAFSIIAVNCYVLISGYFLVNSKCDRKKIIKIITQVLFYSWIIYIIFEFILKIEVPVKDKIRYVFPITLKTYWFVTCYIILYMLAPFINRIIKNITKKEYKILLGILFFISVSSSILSQFSYSVLDDTNGYGIIWFITVYCIGGYIRLHVNKDYNKYKYLFAYIIISIFMYCSRLVIRHLDKTNTISSMMFYNYNSITATFSSIFLFMYFKNIKINIGFIKNIIIKIAPLTFAVYIIHEQPLIRKILYKNILHTDKIASFKEFIIYMPISCVLIFTICCIVEFIRTKFEQQMFKISKVNKILK